LTIGADFREFIITTQQQQLQDAYDVDTDALPGPPPLKYMGIYDSRSSSSLQLEAQNIKANTMRQQQQQQQQQQQVRFLKKSACY